MNELVSVILPAFNEADSIIPLIEDIHQELAEFSHEILLIDDNSPDGTYEVVKSKNLSYVRCFKRTQDKGLAQSIARGIQECRGDRVVIMDSDYNHSPEFIPFMVQSLSDFDVVMGSRFLYGGRGANRSRHLLSWAFNLFIRILTDGRITDSLFGFIAIHKQKLQDLDHDDIFYGFGEYGIRFTYWCQKKGFRILQVPTVIGDRIAGTGHGEVLHVFASYVICALKLVRKHGRINMKTNFSHPQETDLKKSA